MFFIVLLDNIYSIFFIGIGVFAKTFIPKSAYILEYKGKLISEGDKKANMIESMDQTYIYEFSFNKTKYW